MLTVELGPPILYQADMPAVLRWLAHWMQEKHGLAVTLQADEQVNPQAQDVRVLLFQSVRELLFNIVKHAQAKNGQVVMTGEGDQVRIVVSDEGVGFDPTRHLPDTAETGFGLFSIRERLEAMGGRMEIDSAAGHGTRITLQAPLGQLRSTAIAKLLPSSQSPRERHAALPGQPGRKPGSIRVLLADDHDTVREGLASLMQAEPDMDVVGQAHDGAEAVELARTLRPDVVVMDVTMPGLNGIQTTRQIRSDCESAQIIGLSMHEGEDVAAQMLSAGAAAYLTKGGSVHKLFTAIRSCARPRSAA